MKLTREILSLAVPSILAGITVPLVGMADIAVAGHLGGAAAGGAGAVGGSGAAALIGGITIGTMLFDLLYWNFSFLRAGTGGLTAQAYGRLLAYSFAVPGPHPLDQVQSPCPTATPGPLPLDQVHGILQRALRIALISGVVLIALQWAVVWLAFMIVQCTPEVRVLATQYFHVRIWAAPATLALFAYKGWFIGLQDGVRPMIADLLVNGLNIFLSFALGFGWLGLPRLGFAGIALGTVIAQWSGFVYAALAAHSRMSKLRCSYPSATQESAFPHPVFSSPCTDSTSTGTDLINPQPDSSSTGTAPGTESAQNVADAALQHATGQENTSKRSGCRALARLWARFARKNELDSVDSISFFTLNRDLLLRAMGMIAVYIGFTMISARFGDTLLAVSAILMKLLLLFSYFADGFAYAGEALTGRFIGADDSAGVCLTVRETFIWGLSLAAAFMLLYGFGGVPAFKLFTSDLVVVEAGREFIPWLLLMPFIGIPAFIWDGIFTGATASKQLRNSVLWSVLGFFGVWLLGCWVLPMLGGSGLPSGAMSGSALVTSAAGTSALGGPLAIHLLMCAYFMHLAIRSVYMSFSARRVLPLTS